MKKSKPAGSKKPSSILEFEVSGSSNTLRLAGFREPETRAEFYDDLGNWWQKSPKDLADEMDELPPLAYEVQSHYADVRDNLIVLIDEASGKKKPDVKKIAQLRAELASMPQEPELGVADWLRGIDHEYFETYLIPRILQWLSDPPDWNNEDDYLPANTTGCGWTFDYFREMDQESLELIGVEIVEGDRPFSDYCAAELRGDIEEANKAAEGAGLEVRFVKKQE